MLLWQPEITIFISGTNSQTCELEVFRARCPHSQTIFITEAIYGHIGVSKCVAVDFGYFGCVSDVTNIVQRRCNGKSRCEIPTPDAEIAATKSCMAGLVKYLDITYVCLPSRYLMKPVGSSFKELCILLILHCDSTHVS